MTPNLYCARHARADLARRGLEGASMEAKASRTALSPVNFLHSAAQAMGDRTAVVHGDVRRTYAELAERAGRLASALRAAGVEEEDRVAVLCPNTPVILEAHFGVPATGAILVTINTRLSASEVGFILSDCTPRVVIVDAELAPLLEEADLGDARIVVAEDEGGDYEALLAEGDAGGLDPYEGDEDDVISINYTSGTTGNPKGAMYTHRGAYLRAHGVALEAGMDAATVHLWTLPMFHCNGWCLPWAVTAAGGRHVCLRKVEPARIWELFDAEGVTHYSGAPTVHLGIVGHDDAHPLEQRVTVPTGGSPPSPTLLGRMRELNLHPVHLYGLTETYGPIMSCTPHPEWAELPMERQAELLARQGRTYNGSDRVRVVDDDMQDVPADGETLGEIVMRGNSVTVGYWNLPDETEEAFRGGWFHSGDLGVMHPDGYVELRDRAKDVIISGGENISSVEIEQVLARHPAVHEAAIVATPDEKWGERPKAFVELKAGEQLEAEELLAFCKENLARYKTPAAVEFGELPRTSTGKVQKFLLREREWSGREKAIQ
jgi:fatty-acyl-CoA synthase